MIVVSFRARLEGHSSTFALVDTTQKSGRVALIDTVLTCLLRQIVMDDNVTLDRPHSG